MGRAAAQSGIEIEFETFGSPNDPVILLVNGFTSQMTYWEEDLCQMLVARGRFVIRYDNRDCGLSTHLDGVAAPAAGVLLAARREGRTVAVPYTLSDFATDGMAVLDHLGVEQADIIGVSMGGMIVQTMAIDHPGRVRTLTSIMSHTGEPAYGRSTKEANAALMAAPPTERSVFIAEGVESSKIWSSPRYYDPAQQALRLARDYDRAFYPEGAGRQLGAVLGAPDRSAALRTLNVPTLVVHGRADTLITLSGGERTAKIIPGANLFVLNDMGHDLPERLWPLYVDMFISHSNQRL